MALPSVWISFELVHVHPRTRPVYFYFLRVNFLVKTSTAGRRDQVWLPWQQYICRSKYGCFCSSPQVTYLHTKNEGGLEFFISNFASLSRRIALKYLYQLSSKCEQKPIIKKQHIYERKAHETKVAAFMINLWYDALDNLVPRLSKNYCQKPLLTLSFATWTLLYLEDAH